MDAVQQAADACLLPCHAQAVTRKTRILDVVYNASNNELVRKAPRSNSRWCMHAPELPELRGAAAGCWPPQVRTQTLVKSAIIQVDATPFQQYYQQHYGVEVRAHALPPTPQLLVWCGQNARCRRAHPALPPSGNAFALQTCL